MKTGTTTELTISLQRDIAEKIRAAVQAGAARSVPAYVTAAVLEYQDPPTLKQVLDEYETEVGPIPPEVQAWADAQVADALKHGNGLGPWPFG